MTETFKKDPLETGGILLGHILDNGIWIVMEVLPPGWRSTFQYAYFEYDEQFVNYVAQNESKKYEQELSLLGLWHRHPGSMDIFSGTDDGTNRTFAGLHPKGAISGLVNIDPRFRLTMYHVSTPLHYTKVDVEVGDDLIPEEYFKWKYYDEEKGLNPYPPEKKNGSNISEKQYEIGSGNRRTTPKDSSIITEIMKIFDSKYLFLLLFIVGAAVSLFSCYSYNKLKKTADIKSLYRVYYTEYTAEPSSDTIKYVRNKASENFDKNLPSIKAKLNYDDLLLAQNKDKLKAHIKGTTGDSARLLTQQFKDTLFAEDKEKLGIFIGNFLEKNKIEEKDANIDSLTLAYKEPLFAQELSRQKQEDIDKTAQKFADDFKKSHKLTPDIAKKEVKTIVVLLLIASLLSLLLAFLPRKHKSFVEWLVIGVSVVIATLIAKLLYSLSFAFVVASFLVFALLCFVVFVAMFILKSFNCKKGVPAKSKSTGFWFQQNPKLYLEEESEIRKRFADAEKNVENGVVSFFINTYKKIAAEQDNLSFQLVYSSDYLENKEIKIYLVSPDLDELLGDKIKDFPYIAIDGAGESYLDLSKTIQKDKISGMEVIRKFYEWIQQYKEWKLHRINNIKL
jgi:lipopolysaccharide export LptBFGC system permease protein LptF